MGPSLFDQEEQRTQSGTNLDFKRVLSRAIRFWYVVVGGLGVSLAVAFYTNRYTAPVYSVTASMLIREGREESGAELLYKNALINPYRNYYNEPYIVRSYPLIEEVVRDLNFHIQFYQSGYIVTSEIYGNFPIRAQWCSPSELSTGRLTFTIVDEDRFSLAEFSDEPGDVMGEIFAFNDTIRYGDYSLCFVKQPGASLKRFTGFPYLLEIRHPEQVAGSYISRLSVTWAELGSGVLNLTITGTNAEKEMDFLQALIATYSDLDLRKKNETAARTIKFIQEQLTDLKDSLRNVEFQLERFGNTAHSKDMSAEAQRLLLRIEGIEVQKAELAIKQSYYQYLDTYLAKDEGNLDQIVLPSSLEIVDPILSALLAKLVELQMELKLATDTEDSRNPVVVTKRQTVLNRMTETKADIKEAVSTLRATDKIKSDFINRQLSVVERQLDLLPASERRLISIQRNYTLLENLYVFLMQKLSEAKISEAANTSDIIQVNPPMRGKSISPKPTQNYLIAVAVGLAIPFGIFILFELLNTKIQSKEDIEKLSLIPFLGGLGHNISGGNLAVFDKPKSGIAESFRALRSNLNYFTSNKNNQVFMVSSSISGEGKSFTTINLATVFAMSGKRTLIVGADMRKPKLYQDFNNTNELGLSTYLSGLSEFSQVVQKTTIDNLYMVSGGPVPPNPSELLLTNRFEAFIKQALSEYDFVIIDTPPLALVTDAFVISKFADHTVFVLRQNYTPKEFVRSIDDYYRSGKFKNISLLLNDIYKSGLGYGYGYGQGYSYHYGYGYGRRKNGHGYYEQ